MIFASEGIKSVISSGSPERRIRQRMALSRLQKCRQLPLYMWRAPEGRASASENLGSDFEDLRTYLGILSTRTEHSPADSAPTEHLGTMPQWRYRTAKVSCNRQCMTSTQSVLILHCIIAFKFLMSGHLATIQPLRLKDHILPALGPRYHLSIVRHSCSEMCCIICFLKMRGDHRASALQMPAYDNLLD